jgi:hypothetical protein
LKFYSRQQAALIHPSCANKDIQAPANSLDWFQHKSVKLSAVAAITKAHLAHERCPMFEAVDGCLVIPEASPSQEDPWGDMPTKVVIFAQVTMYNYLILKVISQCFQCATKESDLS